MKQEMIETNETFVLLKKAFAAGLQAVMPQHFMPAIAQKIAEKAEGRAVHLIAFGKGAGAMAEGYFAAGGKAHSGLVIMPEALADARINALPDHIEIIGAAHPVPNQASERAASAALSLADGLGADDLLVVLISGGGSSLMAKGLGNVSLADKKALNAALLASGMPIQEMNIIRKHLSAVKGGRLAVAAYPASVMSFAISDVPGDAPTAIASGPTCADDSTQKMARDLLARYNINVPQSITHMLNDPDGETAFSDDPKLALVTYQIVASANLALQAAAHHLEQAGYQPVILGDDFQDNTAALADKMIAELAKWPKGTAVISGGEASVAVQNNKGVGGRNAQFALEMVLRDVPDICGLSCDTDGIDGAKATAGAHFYHGMKAKAAARGIDARAYYDACDSHLFFEKMGTDIITGPTQTNVNDLRILLKG